MGKAAFPFPSGIALIVKVADNKQSMKLRKPILTLLVLALALPLSARPEFWVGGMVRTDRHYLTAEEKQSYVGTPYGDGTGNISYISSIGGSFELSFFPSDAFRLGLITAVHGAYTINYNNGSSTSQYVSYNLDSSNVFSLGIAYNQLFGRFGFFLNGGVYADLAKICTTNYKNNRNNGPWNRYTETGYYAETGLLIKHRSGYFKLGFFVNHPSYTSSFSDGLRAGIYGGGGGIF